MGGKGEAWDKTWRGGGKVVGGVVAQAIMTPPEMVGARLVPASPFGGPSKLVGNVLALYGGCPSVWLSTVWLVWRIFWRGETRPDLL